MRIGIMTGGGDCPGLNAVIGAVVRKGASAYNDEFLGFLDLPAGQCLCWFSRGTRSVIPDVSDLWRSTRQDGLPAQDAQ